VGIFFRSTRGDSTRPKEEDLRSINDPKEFEERRDPPRNRRERERERVGGKLELGSRFKDSKIRRRLDRDSMIKRGPKIKLNKSRTG
jgi:hypothetical protein